MTNEEFRKLNTLVVPDELQSAPQWDDESHHDDNKPEPHPEWQVYASNSTTPVYKDTVNWCYNGTV